MKLEINLPKNRLKLGKIFASDGPVLLGEWPALGLADGGAAKDHGNPDRDPLKPYGDTPYGTYKGSWLPIALTPENRSMYGDYPVIALRPLAGDALTAGKVRTGILIHSGRLNPNYTQWATLRPTHGCVRILPETHKALWSAASNAASIDVEITAI